ncbi:MAG TPA: hypothetical protein VFO10_18465 [Oligoflexus sp.]|uniref:hypothetical protein n=1 Tax=Oligoflexus sp. TaxID=1971216 RepID=UPI002D7FFCF1|nr:hypothetical protein [Oligoflexus sp.]HET9239250.1 hypothetical protein [Oligoflexus sp.]
MTQRLIEFLRDEIKMLIASKNESLRWFVRQVGVDYSVVYRITTGEQKGVTFYQAYKLLKYIKPDSFLSILGEYFPDEASEFFPGGKTLDETQQANNEKILSVVFQDQLLYEVLLAVNCGNHDLKAIESEFGSRGLGAIDVLQDIGAVKVNTEAHIDALVDGFIPTDEVLIKQQALRNLDLIDLKTPGTTVFSNSAGLNSKGITAAYQCAQAHWHQMTDIFDDEQYKGNVPVVVTGLVGPLVGKERK